MTEDFKERLVGTNIDPNSLLSTDYFNHFNEVIMLFSMMADAPELLDEVDKWNYITYREHFKQSGLGFADLAIEAYETAPFQVRERFEKIATEMSMLVVETRVRLRQYLEQGDMARFADMAMLNSMQLQGMVDDGASVVHGRSASMDQSAIDAMF
jgi:hypothetical protein